MPDPIQEKSLEDAAVIFLKRNDWAAAVGMFAALAHHRPKNSSAWVGIGSALWRMAPADAKHLTAALAATKRALALDPHDHAIKNLLRSAEDSARKAGINPDDIAPYSGDPRPFYPELVAFVPQTLVEASQAMDWDERARLVTLLGDQMDDLFQPLLEYFAASDPHAMVRKQAQQALRDREAYHKAHTPPTPDAASSAPAELLPRAAAPDTASGDDVVVTPAASAPADVVSAIPGAAPADAAAPAAGDPAPRPTAEQAQDAAQKAQQDAAVQKALAERRARLMGGAKPDDQ